MANKIYKIWLLLEKNWNVADYIFGHKVRHSHAMEWSNNSYYASKTGHIFSRVRRLSSRTRQAFFKFWFYPALLSAAADLPTTGGSQKINKQQVNSSFVKARVVNGIQFKTKLTSSKTRKKKDDLMFSSLVNYAPHKIIEYFRKLSYSLVLVSYEQFGFASNRSNESKLKYWIFGRQLFVQTRQLFVFCLG